MNRYVDVSVQVCELEWRTEVKFDSGEQTKYIVRTVYSIMCGVDRVWVCTVRQYSM